MEHIATIHHRPAVAGTETPFNHDGWRWTCSCGAEAGNDHMDTGWRNTEANAKRGHTLHVTKATGRPALVSTRPVK